MVRSCRFYEKKFPDKDEVVMVNVRSIAEMGAYVTLLEYNNIEGMILLSELSRRRIRSINKLVRVGRNEAVMVLRVDQDKGREMPCVAWFASVLGYKIQTCVTCMAYFSIYRRIFLWMPTYLDLRKPQHASICCCLAMLSVAGVLQATLTCRSDESAQRI